MGASSLHRPRYSANLHICPLVLGISTCEVEFDRCRRYVYNSSKSRHHLYYPSPRCLNVDRRRRSPPRPSQILPPGTWQSAILLPLHIPTQDHPLVLCRRHHPELLALRSLWTKLALPLDHSTCTRMGHRFTRYCLLHRHLDRHPHLPVQALEITLLDPPRFRHRARCTTLVPDAVGNISRRTIPPMGRLSTHICAFGQMSLAMARRTRCVTRCRFRYDPPTDYDEIPYHIYPHRRPSPWFHCYYPGASHRTQ